RRSRGAGAGQSPRRRAPALPRRRRRMIWWLLDILTSGMAMVLAAVAGVAARIAAAILPPYRIWLRLFAVALAALVAFGIGFRVADNRAEIARLEAEAAKMRGQIAS